MMSHRMHHVLSGRPCIGVFVSLPFPWISYIPFEGLKFEV